MYLKEIFRFSMLKCNNYVKYVLRTWWRLDQSRLSSTYTLHLLSHFYYFFNPSRIFLFAIAQLKCIHIQFLVPFKKLRPLWYVWNIVIFLGFFTGRKKNKMMKTRAVLIPILPFRSMVKKNQYYGFVSWDIDNRHKIVNFHWMYSPIAKNL